MKIWKIENVHAVSKVRRSARQRRGVRKQINMNTPARYTIRINFSHISRRPSRCPLSNRRERHGREEPKWEFERGTVNNGTRTFISSAPVPGTAQWSGTLLRSIRPNDVHQPRAAEECNAINARICCPSEVSQACTYVNTTSIRSNTTNVAVCGVFSGDVISQQCDVIGRTRPAAVGKCLFVKRWTGPCVQQCPRDVCRWNRCTVSFHFILLSKCVRDPEQT